MRGSLSQNFFGCGDDVFDFKAEFLEQILDWGGRSESVHADDFAFGAGVAVPAENRFHFDGNARGYIRWQNAFFVCGILFFEKLPARHADDAGFDSLGGQLFTGRDAEADFATAGEEYDVRLSTSGVGEDV